MAVEVATDYPMIIDGMWVPSTPIFGDKRA
jgi:hypothetical protein